MENLEQKGNYPLFYDKARKKLLSLYKENNNEIDFTLFNSFTTKFFHITKINELPQQEIVNWAEDCAKRYFDEHSQKSIHHRTTRNFNSW